MWLALLAMGAACDRLPLGYTRLNDVVRAPAQYEGKTIKVQGEVADVVQLPMPDIRYYSLRDGDASIMVFAHETVPATGAHVSVVGVVNSPVIIGGQSVGLHLTEQRRW